MGSIAHDAFLDRLFPTLGHCLRPGDMSFETKRFREIAIATHQVPVSNIVAACPGQHRAQPQQPDIAYGQPLIGWRGG